MYVVGMARHGLFLQELQLNMLLPALTSQDWDH
jgi:hypothetical protein